MPIKVHIVGRDGNIAKLTRQGVLAVDAPAFDLTSFNELAVIDTAYNFFLPKVGHCFIMQGLLAFADKDVSDASDTVVEIYEASSETETTVLKTIFRWGMGKLTSLPLVPLNLLINEGVYLNAKTGDDDIHMTIFGHYVPAVH